MISRLRRTGLCVIAVALLSVLTQPAHGAVLGDVDGDSQVTVQDAALIIQAIVFGHQNFGRMVVLGDLWPPTAQEPYATQHWGVGDGKVTVEDAIAVLRVGLGVAPRREVGRAVYTLAGTGPLVRHDPSFTRLGPHFSDDGPANN